MDHAHDGRVDSLVDGRCWVGLFNQIVGHRVEAVRVVGVDVGVVREVFAGGVVGDVEELVAEVVGVAGAVFVIAGVPDLSWGLLAGGEGVSAFDVLDAFGCGLVGSGSDEDVDVVGHDDEAVELEAGLVAITEEGRDEEVGVGGALEVAMLLEGGDGDGLGARLAADCGHLRESILQGLKPFLLGQG